MKRIAATALLATVCLVNAVRAQEPAWGPSGGGTPVPVAVPPAVVQPKPLIEPKAKLPDVVVPTSAPAPMPMTDNPGWLPARRYNPDAPAPKQVSTVPKEDSNPFRPVTAPTPVSAPSIPAESPFKEVPAPLPITVPAVETSIGTTVQLPDTQVPKPDKPAAPPAPTKEPGPLPPIPTTKPSEQLPLPKVDVPATPGTTSAPASSTTDYTVHLNDPGLLNSAPGGMAGGPVAPTRNRVFGSPSLNLSRDYHFRDIFGQDMISPNVGAGDIGGAQDLFFVQGELLLWWQNRARIPVLATTSTSSTGSGFLGDPQTRNLLGPGEFGPSFLQGFRVRAGGYIDECALLGIDGGFFFLGPGRESRSFDSSQFPVITRPFFAPNINAEFGEVVARPGLSTGRLEVWQDSFLWGIDINVRKAFCRDCTGGTGWFAGYRHLNLTETLSITEFITASGPLASDPVGTKVVVNDTLQTRNRFHGAQVGWWKQSRAGILDIDTRVGLAMGVTNQIVDIGGFQQRTRPGQATQNFVGGLLAAGPNIGQFNRSAFSVIPEITVNVGVAITPNLRAYAGYNFLYWNNVVRPGDQIDRVIDLTNIPNPPAGAVPSALSNRPQPTFRQSDFWAQGVQLGLEFRW